MLDAVRYMVAWFPLLLLGIHFALHFLGVDKHAADRRAFETHLMALHNLTLAAGGGGGGDASLSAESVDAALATSAR